MVSNPCPGAGWRAPVRSLDVVKGWGGPILVELDVQLAAPILAQTKFSIRVGGAFWKGPCH